jgi:hypothetical protein
LRVLLDECVDSRLTASFGNFEVRTVADQGWVGISSFISEFVRRADSEAYGSQQVLTSPATTARR